MKPARVLSFILLFGFLAAPAWPGETVYIVKDKDGNVTYLDHPPAGVGDADIQTKVIDPDANVVPAPELLGGQAAATSGSGNASPAADSDGPTLGNDVPQPEELAASQGNPGSVDSGSDAVPADSATTGGAGQAGTSGATAAPAVPAAPAAPAGGSAF